MNLETEALKLQRELLDDSYCPREYRIFAIIDPKPRMISAAAFRDRVVHHALCAALEPTLERYAIFDSYACRPKKGGYAATKRAQGFARRLSYFLKLDVYKFFETADHDVLKRLLRRLVKDKRALALCDRFIDAGAPRSAAGKGLPIGNLTSAVAPGTMRPGIAGQRTATTDTPATATTTSAFAPRVHRTARRAASTDASPVHRP